MKLVVCALLACIAAVVMTSGVYARRPIILPTMTRRCHQPAGVVGRCQGYFPRYTYNSTTGQCSKFIYGGCPGNTNRFNSFMECKSTCAKERCKATPGVTGPCRAGFRHYTYNPQTKQCSIFTYGGCRGSANRFRTKQQCLATCGGRCQQPFAQAGVCLAYFRNYSYNYNTKKCEEFIYGGCRGNGNRFDTLNACKSMCERR